MFPSNGSQPVTQSSLQKYYGKYPGLVTDNEPPADGAHRGEITVQVPGILEETPDGSDSQALEVVAKPCFLPGFFFIPEVGDQVWVEFAAGDINQPLWTGVWYPDDGAPQTAEPAAPDQDQKVIRTASGHVVTLDDKDGDKKIVVHHTSGAFMQLDKDGAVLLANQNGSFVFLNAKDGELTLGEEHGNLVTLNKDGVLLANIDSKVTLAMKGGKLTILAPDGVDIMGGKVAVHTSTISLGGQSAVEPVVLGNIFSSLYNAHTHPTAMGPSGPPVPPLTPVALSQGVKVTV